MGFARTLLPLAVLAAGCVNLEEPWHRASCDAGTPGCPKAGPTDAAMSGSDTSASPARDGRVLHEDDVAGLVDRSASDVAQNKWDMNPDLSPRVSAEADAFDDAVRRDIVGTPGEDAGVVTSDASVAMGDVPNDGPRDFASADAFTRDLAGSLPDSASILPDVSDAIAADATDAGQTMAPDTADARDASAVDAPPTNTVTFSSGYGQGLMTGEGWVSLGSADSISSPTCGPQGTFITNAAPCSVPKNWSSDNALCVTGFIPALPNTPSQSDFATNWGIQLGVDSASPASAMGRPFSTVTFNMTGAPSSGLRAELHRNGDALARTYCANLVSGVAIPFASFRTGCWDGTGDLFTAADVPKIDKVVVHVPSGPTAITLKDLCLNSVKFQP